MTTSGAAAGHQLLNGLIHRIENLNGREFDDDVAVLLVGSR